MRMLKTSLFVIASSMACSLPALAQHGHAASPHITINSVVDGDSITLSYGSPYTKDPKSGEARQVWGKLIPFDKVWRMGADEATVLTTKAPLMMGDTLLPEGSYSLWALPAADGTAKLVINKQTGQWGTQDHDSQDLARIDLKKKTLDCPIDHFVMAVERAHGGGAVLKLSWENLEYSVPFSVKK